ncbi:MAG: hypothetical protein LC772_06200, partial [Chloroflexi bacterium]|nr:hypothetical protein [Chloroflexota bacterium]
MRKSFIVSVLAGVILSLAASASFSAAAAVTDLSFAGETRGTAAAGWEGSGVVETRNGVHVLHLAGRKDNDIATTPPLPARAGQKYLLSYRIELTVGAGELNVQFRCQDAAGRALRPEWEYPTIETHAVSLPRPATVLREVSLAGVESATDSVRVVFKWWGTPTGDVWIHDVTWQPLEASPALRNARPLDLRAVSNRGFRSGGAVGAWMGDGNNDLSGLEPGTRTIAGVPLVILDPAANGGRSCVVVGNGSRAGFPRQVTIHVGQRAERIFVLHNAAFGPGARPFISSVATWTFEYADGSKAAVHLDAGIHMADWSYPEDTDLSLVAVTTASPDHPLVGLNLAEVNNPRPEAEIRAIEITADGDALYGLVAATLADGGPGAAATLADGEPGVAALKLQTRVEYQKATGEWFPAALPWG